VALNLKYDILTTPDDHVHSLAAWKNDSILPANGAALQIGIEFPRILIYSRIVALKTPAVEKGRRSFS